MYNSKHFHKLKIFLAIVGIGGMIFFTILPFFAGGGVGGY